MKKSLGFFCLLFFFTPILAMERDQENNQRIVKLLQEANRAPTLSLKERIKIQSTPSGEFHQHRTKQNNEKTSKEELEDRIKNLETKVKIVCEENKALKKVILKLDNEKNELQEKNSVLSLEKSVLARLLTKE